MDPRTVFVRRKLLVPSLACIAFTIGGIAAAAAEEAVQAAKSGDDIQTITVSGIRASIASAEAIKKDADAVVDAISAEDIGKFPDKNVAETLSRIPGIQVSHDWGDGQKVSIEGTDPDKNLTLLNGQTVAAANWYWADVQAPGRGFNFDTLPSQVVGSIEVYKSPQAKLEEGSLGGLVVVHTRQPLDMDPLVATVRADGNYNDRAQKYGPDVSGLVSWHNEAKSFGIAVAGVHQDENTRRDGVETFGYSPETGSLVDGTPINGGNPFLVPQGVNSTMFLQERTLDGGTVGIQYRPDDHWEVALNGLYTNSSFNNSDQSYYLQPVTVWGDGLPINSATVKNGILVAGNFGAPSYPQSEPGNPRNMNTQNNSVENDQFVRNAAIKTYSADLKTLYKNDGWRVTLDIGTTRADGGTQNEFATNFVANSAFAYDMSSGLPKVSLPFSVKDNSDFFYFFGQRDASVMTDREHYVQADIERAVEWGPFYSVLAGGKYRDHVLEVTNWGYDNVNIDPNWAANPTVYDNQVTSGQVPANHLSGIGSLGDITLFPNVNKAAQQALLTNGTQVYQPNPASDFTVREKIAAGYVQGDFAWNELRGNIGVRYVHTEQRSDFYNINTGASTDPTQLNPQGLLLIASPVSFTHPYDDVLPSLNLAYNLTPDLVLRAAAAKILARNNYADLAGAVNLNPTTGTGSRGNPNLQPIRADNFDVTAEWYPSKTTLVAATGFYKLIQSYTTTVTDLESYVAPGFPGINAYNITHPINGGGGHNEGLELQAQHDIWGGFGAMASYTYSYAVFDDGGPIPGNSRHAYSLTGFYEDDHISARLSYTYRTKWFLLQDVAAPQFHDSEGELDLATSYNFSKQYGITFDAVNLTDVADKAYDSSPAAPIFNYRSGRRFRLGVNASF